MKIIIACAECGTRLNIQETRIDNDNNLSMAINHCDICQDDDFNKGWDEAIAAKNAEGAE